MTAELRSSGQATKNDGLSYQNKNTWVRRLLRGLILFRALARSRRRSSTSRRAADGLAASPAFHGSTGYPSSGPGHLTARGYAGYRSFFRQSRQSSPPTG